MIPQATEEAIKAAAKIYDVVSAFVTLKKSGVRFVGLCPFHDEKTGSFYVTPTMNICKCYGCGKGGDAVWFVIEYLKKSYPEALEYLAAMYNISIDSTGSKPKKDFTVPPRPAPPPPPPMSIFPKEKMLASLKFYERNHFAQFLKERFGADVASELIGKYFVGTSKHWPGANIFWQVDAQGRVRGGKIMVYDPETGKRIRDKMPTWTHKAAKLKDFVLSQCFYGEHLLSKRPTAPVGIVESEKTAMLASAYLPENIWLASGGKDGLGLNKCAVLKGRNVILWPDAGLPDANGKTAFQLWSDKSAELQKAGYSVTVSNLIERLASPDERANGYDLADYLLKWDLAAFQAVEVPQAAPPSPTGHEVEPGDAQGYPASWDAPTLSRLEVGAILIPASEWRQDSAVQPYTAQDEQDRPKQREQGYSLANWTDHRAGKGPNPYTHPDYWIEYRANLMQTLTNN